MSCSMFSLTAESPLISGALDSFSLAKSCCFRVFGQVVSSFERALIGDLRSLESRISEVKEESYRVIDLGFLFGRVVVWSPSSRDELASVLKTLDAQEGSRSTYQFLGRFLGAKSVYVLSEGHDLNSLHRRELLEYLNPEALALKTWELCLNRSNNLEGSNDGIFSKEDIDILIFQVFAEEVLGMDGKALADKSSEFLSMIQYLKNIAILPSSVVYMHPAINLERQKFKMLLETLLETEVNRIYEIFRENSLNCPRGLLAKAIWEKLENGEAPGNLRFDPELKSTLMVLFGLENLCFGAYSVHHFKMCLTSKLKDELLLSQTIDLRSKKLNVSLLNNKEENPSLHSVMQEMVGDTFNHDAIIMRDVKRDIQVGDKTVPKNSKLVVQFKMATGQNNMSPFSAGSRLCPGRFVANLMMKTIVVYTLFSNQLNDINPISATSQVQVSADLCTLARTIHRVDAFEDFSAYDEDVE